MPSAPHRTPTPPVGHRLRHALALLLTLLTTACGGDSSGRLTTPPAPPAPIPPPDSTALTAGVSHTCGIEVSGTTYCWGADDFGQLGNGRDSIAAGGPPAAVRRPAGRSFTTVKAGAYHNCALSDSGAAFCWGADDHGQVGNLSARPDPIGSPVTVRMPEGVTFVRLAAGFSHSCALTNSGTAYCWGDNRFGQLGIGSTSDELMPTVISMPEGVKFSSMIGGRFHTCALSTDGVAYCWGHNGLGQLGNGSLTNASVPTPVQMPPGVSFDALAAGTFFTCALSSAGAAYCWGENDNGQLGDSSTTQSESPVLVHLPAGVILSAIAAGNYHTCGLTDTGNAFCWGLDDLGQLGDGYVSDGTEPHGLIPLAVVMPPGVRFSSIVAGYGHTCALSTARKAYCWGHEYLGDLDDGSIDNSPVPVPVASELTFQRTNGP